MAVGQFRMRKTLDRTPAVGTKTRRLLSVVVRRTAFELQNRTQSTIRAKNIVDTGDLYNSVKVIQRNDLNAVLRVGVHYGIYHEYGTVKMAARPYVGPSVDSLRQEFGRMIERAVQEGARS
jgi:hypothetical protein